MEVDIKKTKYGWQIVEIYKDEEGQEVRAPMTHLIFESEWEAVTAIQDLGLVLKEKLLKKYWLMSNDTSSDER